MRISAVIMPTPKSRRSSSTRALVGHEIDHAADIVDAQPVLRDRAAQQALVGGLPLRHRALEIGQVFLRGARRLLLVLDQDVDDAVRRLERHRADLGRMIDAEPAALDHRRAAHADRGVLGRDDDVAAAEHRGVAGEAIAGDHADHRHEAGEPCELHEGRAVEAGHAEPVGVAGPAAAAFGIKHQRHAPVFRQRQHAVDLLVVHVALRAREHGVVIGHDDAAGALGAELLGIDGGDAHHEAVGRRALDEIVELAAASLRRDREAAIFHERAVVDELRDVLARGALVGVAAALDRGRPVRIERVGLARDQLGKIRADVVEIDVGFRCRRIGRDVERLEIHDRFAMHQRDAVAGDELHDAAALSAMTRCSIFMDSITASCWPGRTISPSFTWMVTMVPCSGAATITAPSGTTCATCVSAPWPASLGRGKIERLCRAIGRLDQLCDVAIDEIGRDAVGPEIGMRQHGLEEGDVGDDAVDPELAQGARGFCHDVVPGFTRRMHDDLGQQRVERRAGLVAGITKTIDADAGADGGSNTASTPPVGCVAPVSSSVSMLTRSCMA